MSMTQKILSEHFDQDDTTVNPSKLKEPGDLVNASLDLIMVHEQLAGRISKEYRKIGIDYVKNPENIVYILDHWVPSPDARAARMHQEGNQFAEEYGFIQKNILGENKGICHVVVPERGYVLPGILAIGSDSHTTTYGALNCFSTGVGATDVCVAFATGHLWFKIPEVIRVNLHGQFHFGVYGKDLALYLLNIFGVDGATYKAMEFGGDLRALSVSARMTVANMVVEMGAKNAVFEYDRILHDWLVSNPYLNKKAPFKPAHPDKDTNYEKSVNIDLGDIEPLVATPHSPGNVRFVDEMADVSIDQGYIGSCTNGRIEDLRVAAKILMQRHVKETCRCIVVPGSTQVYKQAIKEGLIEIFLKAGCIVGPPTCGACIGGHMGVLGDDEVCVSSTNRNFKGRMGAETSLVYLASPATVAASVIDGLITNPKKYLEV